MFSNPTDKELEEIRTRWFPHHKAKIQEFGPNLFRLSWANPASSDYSIVYIIDHHTLCVYGDLGEAIYQWSGKINLHFLRSLNLDYFHGKCQASEKGRISDNYDFSFDKFAQHLKDEIVRAKEEGATYLDKLDMESFKYCDEDEFGAVAWLREEGGDLDGETLGHLIDGGKSIPLRCASHLIGLQMAAAQLEELSTPKGPPPYLISEFPPVFPCWLWHIPSQQWLTSEVRGRGIAELDIHNKVILHWHPNQDTAPAKL